MKLTNEQHTLLEDSAVEFRSLLAKLTREWTKEELGFGHKAKNRGKGAQVVRAQGRMKFLANQGVELTQGRAAFWRQAEQATDELIQARWDGEWSSQITWLLLRSWNETLGWNEDTPAEVIRQAEQKQQDRQREVLDMIENR